MAWLSGEPISSSETMTQRLDRDDEAALHVEHARPAGDAVLDAEPLERAGWEHCVQVSNNGNAARGGLLREARRGDEVRRVALAQHPAHRDAGEVHQHLGEHGADEVAAGHVVGERVDVDEALDRARHGLFAPGEGSPDRLDHGRSIAHPAYLVPRRHFPGPHRPPRAAVLSGKT
jgi:hypothetical protein